MPAGVLLSNSRKCIPCHPIDSSLSLHRCAAQHRRARRPSQYSQRAPSPAAAMQTAIQRCSARSHCTRGARPQQQHVAARHHTWSNGSCGAAGLSSSGRVVTEEASGVVGAPMSGSRRQQLLAIAAAVVCGCSGSGGLWAAAARADAPADLLKLQVRLAASAHQQHDVRMQPSNGSNARTLEACTRPAAVRRRAPDNSTQQMLLLPAAGGGV